MRVRLYVFHAKLYAQYPQLLRKTARDHPDLLSRTQEKQSRAQEKQVTKSLNRFEKSLIAAVDSQGCDEAAEYNFRYEQAVMKYYDASTKLGTQTGGYDPTPVQQDTFWKIMKEEKQRYTFKTRDKECPYHDKHPVVAQRVKDIAVTLARLAEELQCATTEVEKATAKEDLETLIARKTKLQAEHERCVGEQRRLQQELSECDRHKEQYDTARKKILTIQENLKPKECLIYRDFVNQYTPDGKLTNLVLVCIWRETEGGEQQVLKIHHLCTNKNAQSTDAHYVADVFKYHLERKKKGEGLFAKFHTLYLSGDHGPHFISKETVYHESTWYKEYNVKVHCYFLCSYHAHNRCDSAGREAKRIAKEWADKREGSNDAGVIAGLINHSMYTNAVAIPFEKINTSTDVFPNNLSKPPKHCVLRTKCEFKYWYTASNGEVVREPGIVLCRDISTGDQPYEVQYDLILFCGHYYYCNICKVCNAYFIM